MAITDNEAIAVHVRSEHRVKLRFRTRFKSQVIFLTVTDNLLHHRTHLVHLDGVNNKVFGFIRILLGSFIKAVRSFFDTIIKNIGKT